MHPADLPIAEAARRLRDGSITSVALSEACLGRIAAREPIVNAFVAVDRDGALSAAAAADRDLAAGIDRGPMQGILFAVKDMIDVAGLPVRLGSRRNAGRVPAKDAEVVARLKARGAVCLGIVATYENGLVGPSFDGPYPPARNPWNSDHVTGGSSSGSAAAVAAGMVRLALGSDTGGSIRSPSCYCGAVGLKPTYGALPRDGIAGLSPRLDHAGLVAGSAEDAAIAFAALADREMTVATGAGALRIGYARNWFAADPACDPAVIRALDDAAAALSLAGARITLCDLPDYPLMEAAGAVILHAEGLAIHHAALTGGEAYGRQAYQTLAVGAVLTGGDLSRAMAAAARLTAGMDAALAPFDAILTACVLAPAPPFSAFAADVAVWTAMRTLPFNVTGHPVLALPVGFSQGLPLGMQIIARHGDEAVACRIGAAFEAATDHATLHPALP